MSPIALHRPVWPPLGMVSIGLTAIRGSRYNTSIGYISITPNGVEKRWFRPGQRGLVSVARSADGQMRRRAQGQQAIASRGAVPLQAVMPLARKRRVDRAASRRPAQIGQQSDDAACPGQQVGAGWRDAGRPVQLSHRPHGAASGSSSSRRRCSSRQREIQRALRRLGPSGPSRLGPQAPSWAGEVIEMPMLFAPEIAAPMTVQSLLREVEG